MSKVLTILVLIPYWLSAQSFYNTGLPIGITEGAILKVSENFVNSGNLLNQGELIVGGSWVNTGVYQSSGVGVLELIGGLQALGDQAFIESLRLSGGDKTLSANLTVDHLELMGSRLTIAEGFSLEIRESGTISRQPEDYIIGHLIMTDSNTYPIGTANYFLPVTLHPLTDNPGPVGIKAVESPLNGPLDGTVAEIAPFHWVLDGTDSLFNVRLGFQEADFLKDSIVNAIVVQAERPNGEIHSLYQDSVSGSVHAGFVTNATGHPLSLPYFSIGRRYVASEKPAIKVLNLVSPNGDGKNDFLFIQNIEAYPGCLISIFDRWGTKVFEESGYDNKEKVFQGRSNLFFKKELTEGTYFYVIRSGGEKLGSGFFVLMR